MAKKGSFDSCTANVSRSTRKNIMDLADPTIQGTDAKDRERYIKAVLAYRSQLESDLHHLSSVTKVNLTTQTTPTKSYGELIKQESPKAKEKTTTTSETKEEAKPKSIISKAVDRLREFANFDSNFIEQLGAVFPKAANHNKEITTGMVGKTIADLIRIKKIPGISTIKTEAFARPEFLIEALTKLGVPEVSAKILSHQYFTFAKHRTVLAENHSGVYALREPLTMFQKEDKSELRKKEKANIPPQMMFAMMVSTIDWIQQNPVKHRWQGNSEMERFLYGSQSARLDKDELQQLEGLGYSYQQTVAAIGNNVASLLNMSPTDKDASLFYDNLIPALGMAALEIGQQPGALSISEGTTPVPAFTIATKPWKFAEDFVEGRLFNNPQEYLHIVVETKDEVVEFDDGRSPFTKVGRIVFEDSELTATEHANKYLNNGNFMEGQHPLSEPPKSVVSSIRNTFGGVPRRVKKTIRKLQNVVWTTSSTMDVFAKLADGHMYILELLAGVKYYDEDTTHPVQAESLDASNQNKTGAIEKVLYSFKEGKLAKFYFKYSLMNQHRIIMQGPINPQASHITRHLIRSHKSVKYTKENIHLFKLAVLANLGYGVDKEVPIDIVNMFDTILKDPAIIHAVHSLQKGDMAELAKALLAVKTTYKKGDISILQSITALAEYKAFHDSQKAEDGKVKSFDSDISMEIDGVTNGFAMNILQFPLFGSRENLELRLNQIGTYVGPPGSDETKHLLGGLFKKAKDAGGKLNDVYLDLGAKVRDYATIDVPANYFIEKKNRQFSSYWYTNADRALTGLYDELQDISARDLVKYPFMIFQYGGGVTSISQGVADDIVFNLYEQLGEMQRAFNDKATQKEKDAYIKNEVAAFTEKYTAIIQRIDHDPTSTDKKVSTPKKAPNFAKFIRTNSIKKIDLGDKFLRISIGNILAPRFEASLEEMLGETKQVRDAVVQGGEILHAVFQQHYKKAYAEKQEELRRDDDGNILKDKNGKDVPTRELSVKEETDLIREKLIDLLPQYKGPLIAADESDQIFVDLSKRSTLNKELGVNSVEFAYKKKGKRTTRSSSPKQKEFTAPGVSALIRMIINMDSSLMALSLDQTPEVLSLYDAFMGNPEDLQKISKMYGEKYLELGRKTNVTQSMLEQINSVIAETEKLDKENNTSLLQAADDWIQEFGHANQNNPEEIIDLQKARMQLKVAAYKVQRGKEDLEAFIEERGGIVSHQMYMAELAATNTDAAKSFNEREADLLESINRIRKKKLFEDKKSKILTFPKDVQNAYKKLINSRGLETALDVLFEYSFDNVSAFIELALADPADNIVKNVIRNIDELRQPGDVIDSKEVLKSFLAMKETGLPDGNALLVEHLIREFDNAAVERAINNIEKELSKYALGIQVEQIETILDPDLHKLKEEMLSLGGIGRENPTHKQSGSVNSNNIKSLFDKFTALSRSHYTGIEDMKAHTDVLNNIVSILGRGIDTIGAVNVSVEDIDGITQGRWEAARNRVSISLSRQAPPSVNGQSPQEVYVHEMLHALTTHALNSNTLVKEKVRDLFKQVKAELDANGKYKVFLAGIDNPSAADIEIAKTQYRYLFENTLTDTHTLAEFLAYAVTNKALVQYLQGVTPKIPVRDTNLIGKLLHIVEMAIDAVIRHLNGTKGANAHAEMIAVVEQLIGIQTKHESRYSQFLRKVGVKTTKYEDGMRDVANRQAERLIKEGGKVRTLANAAIGGLAIHLNDNAASGIITRKVHSAIGTTLRSIAQEVGEGALTKELTELLLTVKNKVGKARQETERDSLEWFEKIWKKANPKTMHVNVKKALTNVLLRTDLSSLTAMIDHTDMTYSDILDLLNPSKNSKDSGAVKIKHMQKDILRRLNVSVKSRIIEYTSELGKHIATGETTLENAHNNVHTLIQSELSANFLIQNPNTEYFLDAYATLVALEHTDKRQLSDAHKVLTKEFNNNEADNAFIDLLQRHMTFKEAAKRDNFDGNPRQMYKGWIVDRVDNLTSMVTGTPDKKTFMKKAGYPESYNLANIPGVSQAHTLLYIGRHVPEIPHVSGIMSITGQNAMGTNLVDILAKDDKFQLSDGSPDYRAIQKEVRKIASDQRKGAKGELTPSDVKLRPIRDDQGNIVDYRVMMTHAVKDKLLQPDLEFQNVFAHMESSVIDKKNTITHDKQAIDLLVHEQVKLMPSMPERFVNILDKDSPFYERYIKLPGEIRHYIQQYTINDTFMVREDIIDKLFGYTALDLSQLKFLQKDSAVQLKWVAGMAHYLTKQTVAYGVDRIVIGTFNVVGGNLMSNIFQLAMRRISPFYTMHKIAEGYKEYLRYQADLDSLRKLNRFIRSKGLDPETSPEGIETVRLRQSLEGNKLHRMSEAGLNSLIVEDLNEAASRGYVDRVQKIMKAEKFGKITEKIPNSVGGLARLLFMTRTSAPYRFMRQVVQLTDFLARYTMIEHATTIKGQDFNSAMHEAINAFVLFDENMSPTLEAVNSVAGTLFTSYWMRNQRAARNLIKTNPISVMTSAGLQQFTDLDTLANINSSIYAGRFLPSVLQLDDVMDKVTSATLAENLGYGIEDIF